MGRKKMQQAPLAEIEQHEQAPPAVEDVVAEGDVDATPTVEDAPPKVPDQTTPEWQPYVMAQFEKSDLDPDGNPTADACRLVAMRLLGTVLSERIHTVEAASPANEYRATVECSVTIAWQGNRDDIRVFEDVAEVSPIHMDIKYARHAASTAKTKAMGRAYKAALALKKVYTAEEMGSDGPGESRAPDGMIQEHQKKFIDNRCRQLNIDGMKFINMGKKTYKRMSEVSDGIAGKMIEKLAQYQGDPTSIPADLLGYNPDWMRNE